MSSTIRRNWLSMILLFAGVALTAGPLDEWRTVSTSEISGSDVAFGNGVFVTGWGKMLASRDGVNWQETADLSCPNCYPGHQSYIVGISFCGGQFVAGAYRPRAGTMLSLSTNGFVWGPAGYTSPGSFNKVTYADDWYVGVESFAYQFPGTDPARAGGVWISRNLKQWTKTYGDSEAFFGVAAGNRLFVAVGPGLPFPTNPTNRATIVASADGVTWTRQQSGPVRALSDVAFGADKFVAVGPNGTILSSTDGVNWTEANSGTLNSLNAVAYSSGIFAAVGAAGTIVTSPDGVSWNQRPSGTDKSLTGICYGQGTFVAVGPGIILQSGKMAEPPRFLAKQLAFLADGGVRLLIEGLPNRELLIETSDDLFTWQMLTTITNSSSGIAEFIDFRANGGPHRFYRALQP